MKLPDIECARAVRDCGMDAMDALNEVLYEVEERLSPEVRRDLRLAVGRAMDAILTEMVNPAIRAFADLEEEDEAKWGEIAIEQARRRVAERANRPAPPPPAPLNEEVFRFPGTKEGNGD